MGIPVIFREDGSETELPFKWVICSTCQGHGKSSAYLGAYTCDDMAEAGPEFYDDYMAGRYDRQCDVCEGLGRVRVADTSRMSNADVAEFRAQARAERECRAIEAAERRMGA